MMHKMETILVNLDLSSMDEHLIRYTFSAAQLLDIKRVILLHLVRQPNGGKETYEQMAADKIKGLVQNIKSEKQPEEIVYEITSSESDIIAQINNIAVDHGTDLIVVGKKKIGEGEGILPRRLAARSSCSVLALTENGNPNINKVLVPIDFSETSSKGFERALEVAQKHPHIEIVGLHIFGLPTGYHTSGKSPEEYSKILRKHAEKRFENFVAQYNIQGLKISSRFHFDASNSNQAKIIFNVGLVEDVDLIVMGSKGRTGLATLLGSTTKKVLINNLSIPTLVIKDKEKHLNFFQALLQMK